MQILGLYTPGGSRDVLKNLKELQNSQLSFPIVLTLERQSFNSFPDHINIFPMLYSVDRRATIPQVLAQSLSLCKDEDDHYMPVLSKTHNIRGLSIYLIDSSDIPSIYALAKEMAVYFPQISWLNLWFEHRCNIVSFLLTVDDYNLKII